MIEKIEFPKLATLLEEDCNPSNEMRFFFVKDSLKRILPDTIWECSQNLKNLFSEQLPFVKMLAPLKTPGNISFYCLFKHRTNGFKFFYDLLVQWLIPGKILDPGLVVAADFRIPEFGNNAFTLCEITVAVNRLEELEQIIGTFPSIERDLCLGICSPQHARCILEVKGLSSDQKSAMVQEYITGFLRRIPKIFDSDIFSEMQHVLSICHSDFKAQRTVRHLGRIINAHYLFRKDLLRLVKESPSKRQVLIKVFKNEVSFTSGRKNVLGIVVGLNFLRDKEVFEQNHFLKAINHYLPNAEAVEETFFSNRHGREQIGVFYLEIEKSDGKSFTREEIVLLQDKLPNDLKNHIGTLTLPVFMPRNEEEIMRNILSLGNQLKYLRDIPQVFISFDEQTDRNLSFTVIFVRLLSEPTKPIQELFKGKSSFLKYVHDRIKTVGYLRRKYPKEATVFRVKFPKDVFIRGDHSVDLYRARQAVVNELGRILGEFRDFNGGMIAKQNELLTEVRTHLDNQGAKYNELLLENFFYSLSPVIMRTVLEPHAFKELFQMLLESMDKGIVFGNRCSLRIKSDSEFCFAILSSHTRSVLDDITRAINKLNYQNSELAQGYVRTPETMCLGYIYRCADTYRQMQFQNVLENAAGKVLLKSRRV